MEAIKMERLTEGELEVMQVLWDHGKQNPQEIQERFPRSISNMALRAALKVLMDKGHVKRHKVSRAYYYQAKTSRDKVMKKMVHRMANVFAGGSPFALIKQLVKSEELSEENMNELKKIASIKNEE